MRALSLMVDRAGGPQVICARTYTGMPFTAGNGLNGHGPSMSQLEAREMFVGMLEVLRTVDMAMAAPREKRAHGFCTVAQALVLDVRSERDGRPATLESVGAHATTWRHEPTLKGVGFGLMKATAWMLRYAKMVVLRGKRDRRRYLATQQEAFERGRQVERFDQADRVSRKRKMEAEVESYFRKARSQSA